PTNEGMFLTSVAAAHDFGYLTFGEVINWLERNLDSWDKTERFRGHPLNWYDTQTLQVLAPGYVSTVDSGNLAAAALTVRQTLHEFSRQPILGGRALAGIYDGLGLLGLTSPGDESVSDPASVSPTVTQLVANIKSAEQTMPRNPVEWQRAWQPLERALNELLHLPVSVARNGSPSLIPDTFHAQALRTQIDELRSEFAALFPWVALFDEPDCPVPQPSSAARANDNGPPLERLRALLSRDFSLTDVENLPQALTALQAELGDATGTLAGWFASLLQSAERGAAHAASLRRRSDDLAERLREVALAMDFTFLFDAQRKLFSIGYNLSSGQLDRSHYDLLASEARLASFLAIGKGDVDHRHWFHLGRPMTQVGASNALLSWGGTMFEYLMPNLFLRSYEETLLTQSCVAATQRQIEFGRQQHLVWGISESAFAAFDNAANYQYRSFGVPGLGLKRGLADDRVVAPYATGLALMVTPRDAWLNLQAITREGGSGEFGYYDAIDYTTTRLAPNETKHVLRCYFAHHQGMLLAALDNCLFEGAMQRRFHREPRVRAAEWLLQERVPIVTSVITPHGDEMTTAPVVREPESSTSRWLTTPHTVSPRAHLLSNGNYTVMVTNAGGGYSNCRETRLTRWQSDRTCDNWGQFLYLRDRQNGKLWSPTYQPTQRLADDYEVLFSVDKAEFRRRDDDLETRLEVAVVPDTDAEVRLLTIVNYGTGERTIEVTSFAEIALCPADADLAHPAFQKLFIETEYLAPHRALLARRRPRSVEEQPRWAAHVLAVDDSHLDHRHVEIEYETDRAKFLGRGGTVAAPAACAQRGQLSGTVGPVLDPVFSLRCTVRIPPGESVRLAFTTAYATTRDQVLAMADQFHELRVVQGAFELAWAHAQVALRHVHLTAGKIHLFQRLSSLLLYPDATKRASEATIAANRQGQPGLWRYGVSGDFPIVLVRITHPEQDGLVRELLLAHEFWRSKNFVVELVILNEHPTSYVDAIQEHLNRLLSESGSHGLLNQRGGVFVLQATRIPEEEQTLLMAVATVVLHGADGSLESQLETTPVRKRLPDLLPKRSAPPSRMRRETPSAPASDKPGLFANRLGQFSSDGREYVVQLTDSQWTPAPWSNVIANASLGCIVTDSGSGYTWFGNSRENKLTSWSNDPIRDTPSEAIYVRDEETGEFWSPTPLPIRESEPYTVHHGQGYTRFEHASHGIEMDLIVSVAEEDPVKILRLKLRNTSPRPRELSVTAVVEWVLGVHRQQTQMHVITSVDPATQALLAVNHYNHEFAGHVAFLQVVG
ncbi:MAG: cyclic beta 1-2 glucan synthetase, partial [Planctomycetaceae bacterium]|nr:cyclic beta 1-2 glucan synthetase [Planctomycetaceae bacterium]